MAASCMQFKTRGEGTILSLIGNAFPF